MEFSAETGSVPGPEVIIEIERRMQPVDLVLPEVAAMLREMQSGDLEINTKSSAIDLVTKADVACEEKILERIRAHFPEDDILAEESSYAQALPDYKADFRWVIDPVDGTINYAHGLPLYGVSIGLMYRGRPVAGTIAIPALHNTYRAIQGQGATRDGKSIRVSEESDFSKSLVVTGFPYERKQMLEPLLAGIESMLLNARGIRRTGTATVDMCWLAEGRFDALYELNLSPWDTCAGTVIAREAGARITDFSGAEYDPYGKVVVASNGRVHEQLLKALEPVGEKLKT